MSAKQGIFIAIEGIDHSGKDTQQELLCSWLKTQGCDIVSAREPGGTPLGEEIRQILLRTKSEVCAKAELLLFMASRAQFVQEVVMPTIKSDKILVTNRYFFSSLAYQGFGRGLSIEELVQIAMFVTNRLIPDLTILIDLDVKILLSRRRKELADRIEKEEKAFYERVRFGFLELAKNPRWRIETVDGSKSIDEIHSNIVNIVQEKRRREKW